jgi:hypothetical protein
MNSKRRSRIAQVLMWAVATLALAGRSEAALGDPILLCEVTPLGTLGGGSSFAYGANDAGVGLYRGQQPAFRLNPVGTQFGPTPVSVAMVENPEPATVSMMDLGLAMVDLGVWRRRNSGSSRTNTQSEQRFSN